VPAALAGPALTVVLLLLGGLLRGHPLTDRELAGQAVAVVAGVAVNLFASRRAGLRLVAVQTHLVEQVTARSAAEHQLRLQQAELTRRTTDLDALALATNAVLTGSDARRAICSAARTISGAMSVMLFEPDATGRQLQAHHTDGLELPAVGIPVDGDSRTAQTFRTGQTQVIADVVADPGTDQALVALFHSIPGGSGLRSSVFLPVVHDGLPKAVLVVTLTRPLSTGQDRVLGLLELLAADAALALSREDLLAELGRQSVTDPLTGLANRRRWETDLRREVDRAARTGQPLSVLALDLDHFKAYNDAHGHPAGDALLRETATAWQRQLRVDDLLARTGGEEFAVLLPACSATDAARLAQALLRAVPRGQTCSAGVAQWRGGSPDELLARADAALYAAKAGGRDRVETAARTESVPAPGGAHLRAVPATG
jgi:diguanylate cyclase (GGDEF)-like protein